MPTLFPVVRLILKKHIFLGIFLSLTYIKPDLKVVEKVK
jgi:hypothetical protein